MTPKQKRHQKILDLISSRPIRKQEVLGGALREVGISATQSTLSKDIKELGVLKAPDGKGGFRYQLQTKIKGSHRGETQLWRELANFVVEIDGTGNIMVVKTITGYAQGVCESIDQSGWTEIVGTIAGENTIFILCRSEREYQALKERVVAITGLLKNEN